MKTRYRLFRRGIRGGAFYCVDTQTGTRTSLRTRDEDEAQQIVLAKNQAERQPMLNLQIAKAYLAGTDAAMKSRTWGHSIEALTATKHGENQLRWITAAKDKAFGLIRDAVIVETTSDMILKVLRRGTVSTNVYLRRLHNFCVDMNWLAWPLVPKRRWPAVRYGERRAITLEEHLSIVERELNPERKAFYELAWHLGASQTDLANLEGDNIDRENRIISYARKKTGQVAFVCYGDEVTVVLDRLPTTGPLFPYLRSVRAGDRATEFKQRCDGLGIHGVSLHSYRYAWAQRAKTCGYPERFAQEALGHNSKAVHRAYARQAKVILPSLESYEREFEQRKVVMFPSRAPQLRLEQVLIKQ